MELGHCQAVLWNPLLTTWRKLSLRTYKLFINTKHWKLSYNVFFLIKRCNFIVAPLFILLCSFTPVGNPLFDQRTRGALQGAGLRKRLGTTEPERDPVQRTDVEDPKEQVEWDPQRERTGRENNHLIDWVVPGSRIWIRCDKTVDKVEFRGWLVRYAPRFWNSVETIIRVITLS